MGVGKLNKVGKKDTQADGDVCKENENMPSGYKTGNLLCENLSENSGARDRKLQSRRSYSVTFIDDARP
jgi:hypothetical protein